MNKVSQILNTCSINSNCALIPFLTAGYPSIDLSIKALFVLDSYGADIIELGIPYSDALADGPLIQNSSKVALEHGIRIDEVLSILQTVSSKLTAPIIIFSYYNPILVRGIDKFVMEISLAGAKGLIIPDLPIEETDYLVYLCGIYDIELILFIAPTSSYDRISIILSKSPGCLYLVSSTGVTGIRSKIDFSINKLSSYIKSQTDKSIMLGFGISNTIQASQASQSNIDGIVIGSAFINILSNPYLDYKGILDALGIFCLNIKSVITSKK
uniref:Tryptophan synthase alpha chain n=1 Tax=Thuretia quercifolia TaxID=189650 RepID=A0A1Z1MKJ2_9FLOR|nr:Tryptophan synthase alpha subunit [Thuretia quercifolia]ARW66362.1 Tryptophan synthase alpha subunit [Thuretia quercifolia]